MCSLGTLTCIPPLACVNAKCITALTCCHLDMPSTHTRMSAQHQRLRGRHTATECHTRRGRGLASAWHTLGESYWREPGGRLVDLRAGNPSQGCYGDRLCAPRYMRLLLLFSKNNVSLSLVQFQPVHHLRLPVIPGMQGAFQDQSWRRFPLTSEPVLQPDPGASSSSIGKYLQPVSDDDTIIELLLDGIQTQLLETETAASQQNSGTSSSCVPLKMFPRSGRSILLLTMNMWSDNPIIIIIIIIIVMKTTFFFITFNQTRVSWSPFLESTNTHLTHFYCRCCHLLFTVVVVVVCCCYRRPWWCGSNCIVSLQNPALGNQTALPRFETRFTRYLGWL